MTHLRLAELLFNRPLLLAEDKLNTILRIFGQRSGVDLVGLPPAAEAAEVSEEARARAGYQVQDGVATIGVFGPLLHRRIDAEFPSGGPMTYAEVRRAFDTALADDAVHTVAAVFGTPGGEASGAFDLADHVYEARGQKHLLAVVDETAYSAGYLLASAFDRILIPRTGGLGSIGVIATHADFSRAEAEAGITVTHVYAGARKADFSPHQPLSNEATKVLQASVDDVYALFVETVARNRGLSAKAVRATEAGLFWGPKAVAAKLADEVVPVARGLARARTENAGRPPASASSASIRKEILMADPTRPAAEAEAAPATPAPAAPAPAAEAAPPTPDTAGQAADTALAEGAAAPLSSALRPPSSASAAADPRAVIAACKEAGLEALATACIEDALSLEAVTERLARVNAARDVAAAAKLSAPGPALLQAWAKGDPAEITRQVLNAARPEEDDVASHHTGTPAAEGRLPDTAAIYGRLRQELAAVWRH